MSTTYGTIIERNGDKLIIEAYGTTHTVKLERHGRELIAFNSYDEINSLISALELVRNHCWEIVE